MQKKKIVVTEPMGFYPDQVKRLKSLGEVRLYNNPPKSPEEWMKRCKGAEIVCSRKNGLKEKIYEIKGVFFSLPFVGVGWIDKNKLKKNKITVAYCPGCNRHAVSEWIIAMMLMLLRQFDKLVKTREVKKKADIQQYLGLAGKEVCILGKGNIGSRVAVVCQALEMKVKCFKKGDDLFESIKNADVVVNTLGSNQTTVGLLDKKFFKALKKGSYFITVTGFKICDCEAMLEVVDGGILAGVADDAGGILPGDTKDPYYKKLVKHPKILVTPHISYQSDVTARVSNDMMIDNVEGWIKGKPINLLK